MANNFLGSERVIGGGGNNLGTIDDLARYASSVYLAPAASATLRNIATRCRINTQMNTSYQYHTANGVFVNRGSSVPALSVVMSARYSNGGVDTTPAGPSTYSVNIEYPIGSGNFTVFTWSGSTTGTAAAGTDIVSDFTTLAVPIPQGASFRASMWQYSPAGILFAGSNSLSRLGEGAAYSATAIPNTVAAGAAASGVSAGSTAIFYPLAFLGMSVFPSLLLTGDSRVAGTGDTGFNSYGLGDVGELARQIGPQLPYCTVAVPGETLAGFNTNSTWRVSLAKYHTHIASNYGINDLQGGAAYTALESSYATFLAKFAALSKPVWLTTIYPITTSTDSWVTLANQTKQAASTAARITFNDRMRANGNAFAFNAGYQGFFDNSSAVESAYDSGLFNILPDGTAMTGDGIHLNAGGSLFVARQRTIDTRVFV